MYVVVLAIIIMVGIGLFLFVFNGVPQGSTSQGSNSDWDNSNVWRFGGSTSNTYYNTPARGAECDYCGCPDSDGNPPRIDPGCPPQVMPCPARNYCGSGSNSKGWSGYAPF
jgi:hypothetical protein